MIFTLPIYEKKNVFWVNTRPNITPSCVESEAIPYELLVITVMIDVGEALRSRGFDLILF
jgi:hypothetical protein